MFISDALLPKEANHYIVPDCQVAKDYLELFELSDIQGVVFTQTAAHCVSGTYWGVWLQASVTLHSPFDTAMNRCNMKAVDA